MTAQHLLGTFGVSIALLVSVLWLLQLLLTIRVLRTVPPLTDLNAPPPCRWPRLSMIVPARDEAGAIEAALASKLACGYPELEIVAVDDRSRDATGAILDRAARSDPRLRVVHVDSLPEGWLGKLHAMKRGLELATGEWVLFSDADVHVEKGTLERLIAHAEASGIDFISLFPSMRRIHPLIDCAIAALLRLLSLTGRIWSANDDRSHIGVGVGAFNLARRRVLDSTGAIDELRMEVADDVALGALLKQSGARCRLFAARSDVSLVFLDSMSAFARSTDKGGGILGYSWWKPILFSLVPLAVELAIPIAAILEGGRAAIFGAAALLFGTLTHLLLCAHFAAPLAGALLWPIGHTLNMLLTLRAGLRAWKNQGIFWRDTFYSRATLEAGRRLELPSLHVSSAATRSSS
jgi:glycosyltransferase involved in cell wall biosynthesis